MIKKIKKRLLKRQTILLIFTLVLIGVLIPNIAFAETPGAINTDEVVMKIQEAINIAFGVVHAAFWPILLMLGSLMDNDLIFGPGIGERLREIWVIIRNIVNIVFVFLLLVVAFYNVVGIGGEGSLALKTILPKFIMALVAVNFSFLGCKVILDAANVVSIAVYDIAGAVNDYSQEEMIDTLQAAVCSNTLSVEAESSDAISESGAVGMGGEEEITNPGASSQDYSKASMFTKIFCCNNGAPGDGEEVDKDCAAIYEDVQTEDPPTEIYTHFNGFALGFFQKLDQNNIGTVMAINLGSLNNLTSVADNKGVINIKDLTINTIFSMLMYIVFGIAYIALFMVLLARLVVLWLVIALSPVIVLTWVVPQINQYASELNLGERFMKHLIAPIIIGLSMSVGYLMAEKVKQTSSGGVETQFGETTLGEITDGDITGTLLTPNISDIQQLMVACIAVAVVWLGVFGAADQTIASSFTGKIKELGTRAAKFTATLPTYMPFIPIAVREGEDKETFSFKDITGTLRNLTRVPEIASRKKVRTLSEHFGIPTGAGGVSVDFDRFMGDMKSDDDSRKREGMTEMLRGGITSEQEYRLFRDELRDKNINDAPETWSKFKEWYDRTGRDEIDSKYGTSNVEYEDRSSTPEPQAEDPKKKTKESVTQAVTNINGNVNIDTKTAGITEVLTQMLPADKVNDPNANRDDLAEKIVNDNGNVDQAKVDQFVIDDDGKINVEESLAAIT